tara:strand:- start:120 stop:1001 length:882 start_codon:yes stop_codon:yes gene_type:complete
MKGIVLAGGSGTRLHPITKGVSKQLLPIYDKPMIYYPISVLMLAGIKDILIISTPYDLQGFKNLLGTGKKLGLRFEYVEQPNPDGLAQAFVLGENFIKNDSVCLVLGDNIFYGHGFSKLLLRAKENVISNNKASVFLYYVNDPSRFGIAEIDKMGRVLSIQEKPLKPRSNNAVVGLYFYPNDVVSKAKNIKPSERGELEITSLNNIFLKEDRLSSEFMGRGYTWLDTGTHESLADAGEFIRVLEKNQGFKVACLEEISLIKGFISREDALRLGKDLEKTDYGKYIIEKAIKWK